MKRILSFGRLYVAAAILVAFVGAGCSKDDVGKPGPGNQQQKHEDASIDRWMFDYMKTHYLWNEAVRQVTPDYTLGYEDFLDDVLKKVAKQNDVNHDDGHWEGNTREYFYSNVVRYKKSTASAGIQTRGTRQTAEGLGIEMMFYMGLGQNGNAPYAFLIAAVTPGSPVAKAGLKRGDIISQIDGFTITDSNLDNCWKKLMTTTSGSVRLTRFNTSTNEEDPEISVRATTYNDNPVWFQKTFDLEDGRKVGYLCYGSFNYYYDDALIAAFSQFRNEGIDELIIDLRYNGGGHVVSSVVLGTLVAGAAHQGKVYARTTYNPDRKNETADEYKLGVARFNDGNAKYDKIATALSSAIGLDHVHVLCTGSTASASELLINGLRGVDIEVRLIGKRTNGKNVGMEPKTKEFGAYEYIFSPITFYSLNAKDFYDYGNGFDPNVEAKDYAFYVDEEKKIHGVDWGDAEHDEMLALALEWSESGSEPVLSHPLASTRAFDGLQPRELRTYAPVRVQNMVLLPEARQ